LLPFFLVDRHLADSIGAAELPSCIAKTMTERAFAPFMFIVVRCKNGGEWRFARHDDSMTRWDVRHPQIRSFVHVEKTR
jgi:hypothetical protein